MDEELQDEVVMNYVASPILSEFKNQRTPQRVMTLLCDMPGGSHDAGKGASFETTRQAQLIFTMMTRGSLPK